MLEGITQKLLVWPSPYSRTALIPATDLPQGAKKSTIELYTKMTQTPEWVLPRSWTASAFTLTPFDLVFLPGGHDKSVHQLIDSAVVHRLLADFFPTTRKPSRKAVAAVCHGVIVLSESRGESGRSVLADCATTALPATFEQVAFWGTRTFLGDFYKTNGAGGEDVEASVSEHASEG
jgi:putative intracellular protease/amidase